MVVCSGMVRAKDLLAAIALEGKEVLLVALLEGTVLTNVSKFHNLILMKPYQSLKTDSLSTVALEWASWAGIQTFQVAMGLAWVGLLLSFALFYITYRDYQQRGLIDKGYEMAFKDLRRVSRRVAGAFAFYLMGTYCVSFADGFNETILKGSIAGAFVFPPLYRHYNDPERY